MPWDENLDDDYKDPLFVRKIDRLIREFQRFPRGAYFAFHTLVTTISKVYREDHKRCAHKKMPYLETLAELKRFAMQSHNDVGNSEDDEDDDEPRWTYPDFYDYAAAVRELSTGLAAECLKEQSEYNSCYHVLNLDTLDFLHKQAYGEVRTKMFLTVGSQLPMELTEHIFELAMQAEGVPLDPKVRDTKRTLLWSSDPEVVITDYVETTQVRGPYQCSRMSKYW